MAVPPALRLLFAAALWVGGHHGGGGGIGYAAGARVVGIRGVAPARWANFWSEAGTFRCGGGEGKELTKEMVNNNFCDCKDGSDEPGTNACGTVPAKHKFFCSEGPSVFSSRVNDGICDCCDGSDEYGAAAPECANRCGEDGLDQGEDVVDLASLKEGAVTRKQYVEQAQAQGAEESTYGKQVTHAPAHALVASLGGSAATYRVAVLPPACRLSVCVCVCVCVCVYVRCMRRMWCLPADMPAVGLLDRGPSPHWRVSASASRAAPSPTKPAPTARRRRARPTQQAQTAKGAARR